jgi:lipid A disaccharide synthetase
VPELIQHRARAGNIAEAVRPLLLDARMRGRIRRELRDVSRKLGTAGASARAAQSVFRLIGQAAIARKRGSKHRRTK